MAVSTVLAKLGTHCFDASATVAVPNSLGPGELLVRYGTDEQKGYFLPRLADGTLIPCFGLTGPHSGSDATSLIGSTGVVEKRNGEPPYPSIPPSAHRNVCLDARPPPRRPPSTVSSRAGELGVRATFRKRYITLAPVAGVVGVGIDLKDPDNLLGGNGAEVSRPAMPTRSPPHRATSYLPRTYFELTSN